MGCMVKDYPWHLQNFQLLKAKGIGKQTEAMRSPWDLKKGKKRQRLLFETYDVLVKMCKDFGVVLLHFFCYLKKTKFI